jgi:hypothetical protein
MPVICPSCGSANDEGLEYCLKCRGELTGVSPPGRARDIEAAAVSPAASEVSAAINAWRLVPKERGILLQDRAIPLNGERLMLGRFDESSGPVDIELSQLPGGDTTSRNHAMLELVGDAWSLSDLGSTNGVFVRRAGEQRFSGRIVDPVSVQDGDEIGMGMLVFVLQGPERATDEVARAGRAGSDSSATAGLVSAEGSASMDKETGLSDGPALSDSDSAATEWTHEI